MADTTTDPLEQARGVWSDALALLHQNPSLSARDKGWLENVFPEGMWGPTIVLCVPSASAQQALQTDLNKPLMDALRESAEQDIFPAFKIVKKKAEPKKKAEEYPQFAAPEPKPAEKTTQGQLPIPASMPQNPPVPVFQSGQNRPLLDPETHLNKNATFDTFVPGDSNRFARTVALAVAEGSGHDFNPLCIYGGSGLGKTHLLNAIGNYALVKDPHLKVRYVTSEEFTNEFIEALGDTNKSSGQIKEFNRRYREVDVLLIDDIQFLSGKDSTLEQFFHTFNTLHQANKRIVIASDVPPKDLQGFNERLISRFESGLTVDVKPPDLETRIAILRMIAAMNGSNIPNDVLNLIAERFTENIRELEGALNRVTAMASLTSQPVTRALAEQTLQDFFTTDVEIKPADIITQVAKYFYVTFDDIVGRSRTKKIALARQIAMYLVRELTSMSLNDIGLVFGGKDHTTVMHAYTRINDEMQEKQEIYNYVMELTVQLKQRSSEK
ncbi:chromosomal replication initiator protein DnaA [Bifidobacterium sp. UBA6881]|uniref:chromosomal replication initiator protein DnaA n=1 Tax=Bifidobacterium sp. UBA6881 TaxID=1946109 RepID=UPI000EDA03FD|nr:chromosomal replication initiator protein DnaA [Bifidobacterium sp. UBA6881]HAH53296.1 chromosomal replication initiator protein DnaA [Bifidobacterium sp.]HCA74932.1 chromosomal replication initiator protein DnaA [Bifidobacterium sp.]HCH21271.1 chromosomal replication initiator protein DnaA [Bifidobacterium sp.]